VLQLQRVLAAAAAAGLACSCHLTAPGGGGLPARSRDMAPALLPADPSAAPRPPSLPPAPRPTPPQVLDDNEAPFTNFQSFWER